MRTMPWISAAVLIAAFAGCVPSLHPVYTEKDVVFEERLLGGWREKGSGGKTVVTFTRLGENAYRLVSGEEKKTAVYKAHLVRIGKHLLLDLYPGKKLPDDGFNGVPYIPTHWVIRVRLDKGGLRMDGMDPGKLKKMLEKSPAALKHEKVKDGILITAPTAELQKFVLAHIEGDILFSKGKPLERR